MSNGVVTVAKSIDNKVVDNFSNTEFFFAGGLRLRDFDVFARSDKNPELRQKLTEYLIESEVLSSDNSGKTDEEILDSMEARFSPQAAYDAVKARYFAKRAEEKKAAEIDKEEN